MRRKRRAAALLAVLTVVGVTAAAIAGNGGRPRLERVEATITYTNGVVKQRFCEGRDGVAFVEQQVRASGTATGDLSLSGNVTLIVRRLLVEVESGDGFQRGTLVIRGSGGKKKLQARFNEGGIDEIFQGSLVGKVRSRGTLYANWRTTFHENGAVTSQIGGVAPDGRLPAVVLSGRCRGPFERFEFELPAPPSDAARQGRASRQFGKWGGAR
jgi:hypothetical protein